jgi:hypothetical protein
MVDSSRAGTYNHKYRKMLTYVKKENAYVPDMRMHAMQDMRKRN